MTQNHAAVIIAYTDVGNHCMIPQHVSDRNVAGQDVNVNKVKRGKFAKRTGKYMTTTQTFTTYIQYMRTTKLLDRI